MKLEREHETRSGQKLCVVFSKDAQVHYELLRELDTALTLYTGI